MTYFEDPMNFESHKIINGNEISYVDLMEIAQGSPVIGTLIINGHIIRSYKFGGPLIFTSGFIFVPVYVRNIWNSGFKIAKIDLGTLSIGIIGKINDLIFLEKIENDKIYYYDNLSKITIKSCSLI
jgi:hypothetical protein